MTKRGIHDMGGEPAGPLDLHEHVPTLTERRIDAMMQLLRLKPRGFWTTDENRRTIESLAPDLYDRSGYYARWTLAMRGLLVEKGVLTEAEIAKRLKEVKARAKSKVPAKPKAAAKTAATPAAKAKSKTNSKPAPKRGKKS